MSSTYDAFYAMHKALEARAAELTRLEAFWADSVAFIADVHRAVRVQLGPPERPMMVRYCARTLQHAAGLLDTLQAEARAYFAAAQQYQQDFRQLQERLLTATEAIETTQQGIKETQQRTDRELRAAAAWRKWEDTGCVLVLPDDDGIEYDSLGE